MNIYEIQSEFALMLKEHDTANGERISNTSMSISIELVEAVHELLNKEIALRRKRASAGGKGIMSPARMAAVKKASLAAQAKREGVK